MSSSESSRARELAAHYALCGASLRDKDRDLWLAALFAPAAERRHVHALYAFTLEIAAASSKVTQPLLGEMRLQWWTDAIAGPEVSGANAHPVADALLDTIAAHALPREEFFDFLDAHVADFYDDALETLADLLGYCSKTAARPLRWSAKCLGLVESEAAIAALEDAGAALGLTQMLTLLPKRGAQFLPLELLARHGVPPQDASARRDSPQLRAALAELRFLAHTHFAALKRAERELAESARIALLPVATIPLYLERMEAPDYHPFEPSAAPAPWRRQWRLWRAARAGF